ncbi:hypothetical protein APY04_1252 [Hyphomicrobium sulfonivorans]|uniref:Uncharacterized protein n=1 Tax=Hyphomicrobium sulfonivorans TaxID=121290 RepID=A0A109BJM4_HYPSL|nr:hypothetical protein [Hyphomicrobium sulfonivorans]KWT70043.1 hypothetical protein APY04_1252 [Hyphomicrobium sulfonivorans]
MADRELEVGAIVQLTGLEIGLMVADASYRIEQLLQLNEGAQLYRVRHDEEPFDRIVSERDIRDF